MLIVAVWARSKAVSVVVATSPICGRSQRNGGGGRHDVDGSLHSNICKRGPHYNQKRITMRDGSIDARVREPVRLGEEYAIGAYWYNSDLKFKCYTSL